ncbi:MAG TPA: Stp1/IreP family PP2C-type Ser/Thr phosphatase [Syntrophales bacterium]|nr:Stp1/IreP family PP2C-type Ser/Thr phosphatase [Syntrophales bacterium]
MLRIAARTDTGRVRANNEDGFYVRGDSGLLVVADGMGGHASGEVASRMAVDIIRDYFDGAAGEKGFVGDFDPSCLEGTNRLGAAIRLANMAIFEAAAGQAKYAGMGTTVAAVLIQGKRMGIAHVGDSRVYLVRAGDLIQLTDDHSLVAEQLKREMITPEEAAAAENRNILTRALGIAPEVRVDLDEMTVADGDRIVLCSDGLNTMVSDGEILSVVETAEDFDAACDRLIAMANDHGGRDNITVVLAEIRKKKGPVASIWHALTSWFRR